jgi:hypothetical protein
MNSIKTGPSSLYFLLRGLLLALLLSMPTTLSMSTISTINSDEETFLEQSNETKTNTTNDNFSSRELQLEKKCGSNTCNADEYCCNNSCRICASIKGGGSCSTIICDKAKAVRPPRPFSRSLAVRPPRPFSRSLIVSSTISSRAPIGKCHCDSQCPRGMQCEQFSKTCQVLNRAVIPCRPTVRPMIVPAPKPKVGTECHCDSQCPRGMQCERFSKTCQVLNRASIPC